MTLPVPTSTASLSVTESTLKVGSTRVPDDLSVPVARPKTDFFGLVRDVFTHGGPGYLQFAITNLCNADCGFCGFARSQFDPKKRRSVTFQEAIDAIDIAKKTILATSSLLAVNLSFIRNFGQWCVTRLGRVFVR